jgi:hypothetical protein
MNIRNNTHNEVEIITQKEVNKLLADLNTAESPGPERAHPKILFEYIDKPL